MLSQLFRKELKDMAEREEWEDEEIDLAKIFKQNIKKLIEERSKYRVGTAEYIALDEAITSETENLRNAEVAKNEAAQGECAIRNKNASLLQTLGNAAGNIVGQTIGALINRQNVKTVVHVEDEGGIVNSKAMKFVK